MDTPRQIDHASVMITTISHRTNAEMSDQLSIVERISPGGSRLAR